MLGASVTMYGTIWLSLALLPVVVRAGYVSYKLALPPDSTIVHYNDGYIRAPGFIDLGNLTFAAISEARESYPGESDDDGEPGMPDEEGEDGQPPRSRSLRKLDGATGDTEIDIVIFPLPHGCVHSRKGCDWAALGVGNRSVDDVLQFCCSKEAVKLGACANDTRTLGRLILDDDKFKGERRFVKVPHEGDMEERIPYAKMEQKVSGTIVVLFANCNEMGRELFISGEAVWKSVHGYLPGELFGFMFFYTFVTVVYFALLVWFGLSMHAYAQQRIEIEKWVFLAIALGLLEMIFRTGDYFVWNQAGYRSNFIIWIGVLAGVLKQGISRCLIVMVSLGWGVVRDSLGSTMRAIVILGAAYIGISAVRDLMIVFAIEDIGTLSDGNEEEIFSVVRMLTLAVAVIDVIFILWILDALSNTMLYLENMGQTRKLERFLRLRCLFMFAILFATMWAVFTIVDTVNEDGILAEEHAWAIDAAGEVNYLFVLISVAILWRPNPNAREYAYVMELPSIGADGENELELTGVVPSAMDSDDGSVDVGGKGYKNGDDYHDSDANDGRFQIS
jgi:Lung seven transmembrane receptor